MNFSLPLVTMGSEKERALTGVGAMLAFLREDEEALALYPTVYSSSYLEFGIAGTAAGLVCSVEDPQSLTRKLADKFTGEHHLSHGRYVSILEWVANGNVYAFPEVVEPIFPQDWHALLEVCHEALCLFSVESGRTPEETLLFLREQLTGLLGNADS